jgi:glycine/D-amino acid oxidase-like deaminating enzyme
MTAETVASPRLPEADDLVRRASEVLPAVAGARAEAARIGVRPYPADGVSAVGPMPGVSGYYIAVTHSGVTLAPFLGRAVAEEITRSRVVPQLEHFRPSRFAAAGGRG